MVFRPITSTHPQHPCSFAQWWSQSKGWALAYHHQSLVVWRPPLWPSYGSQRLAAWMVAGTEQVVHTKAFRLWCHHMWVSWNMSQPLLFTIAWWSDLARSVTNQTRPHSRLLIPHMSQNKLTYSSWSTRPGQFAVTGPLANSPRLICFFTIHKILSYPHFCSNYLYLIELFLLTCPCPWMKYIPFDWNTTAIMN